MPRLVGILATIIISIYFTFLPGIIFADFVKNDPVATNPSSHILDGSQRQCDIAQYSPISPYQLPISDDPRTTPQKIYCSSNYCQLQIQQSDQIRRIGGYIYTAICLNLVHQTSDYNLSLAADGARFDNSQLTPPVTSGTSVTVTITGIGKGSSPLSSSVYLASQPQSPQASVQINPKDPQECIATSSNGSIISDAKCVDDTDTTYKATFAINTSGLSSDKGTANTDYRVNVDGTPVHGTFTVGTTTSKDLSITAPETINVGGTFTIQVYNFIDGDKYVANISSAQSSPNVTQACPNTTGIESCSMSYTMPTALTGAQTIQVVDETARGNHDNTKVATATITVVQANCDMTPKDALSKCSAQELYVDATTCGANNAGHFCNNAASLCNNNGQASCQQPQGPSQNVQYTCNTNITATGAPPLAPCLQLMQNDPPYAKDGTAKACVVNNKSGYGCENLADALCLADTTKGLTPGNVMCYTSPSSSSGPKTCGTAGGLGILTAIGCIPTDPATLIQKSLQVLVFASGGIALLLMAFGAIEMMASMGNAEALKKANGQFISAIAGLLFILFAVLLMKIIGVDILNLPGFGG